MRLKKIDALLSGMSECSHIKTTAKNKYIYELALCLYDLEGWPGLFFQLKSPNFSPWFSESSARPPTSFIPQLPKSKMLLCTAPDFSDSS